MTLVHLVGFATLLGGCVIQLRVLDPEVNLPMLVGAWTQVASGLVLAGLLELSSDPAHPVNHAKLGVKLGIALIVVPVIIFGLTLRGLGLAPVLVIVVLASAWASRYRSLRTAIPLALGISAFCTFLFVRALGLPLPMVGPWLSVSYWSPPPATAPAAAPAPAPASTAPAQ